MKCRGLTLIELLLVVVIIALLVALLLPVVHSVRRRSYESVCTSNLRQIHAAYALYLQDYGQSSPFFVNLMGYIKGSGVVRCPADPYPRGAAWRYSATMGREINTSYIYYLPGVEDWHSILAGVDANHGIIVCVLHGQPTSPPDGPAELIYLGKVLRLRKDGSVQVAQAELLCYLDRKGTYTEMRHPWHLYTDVRPIPREVLNADPSLRDAQIVPCREGY